MQELDCEELVYDDTYASLMLVLYWNEEEFLFQILFQRRG